MVWIPRRTQTVTRTLTPGGVCFSDMMIGEMLNGDGDI